VRERLLEAVGVKASRKASRKGTGKAATDCSIAAARKATSKGVSTGHVVHVSGVDLPVLAYKDEAAEEVRVVELGDGALRIIWVGVLDDSASLFHAHPLASAYLRGWTHHLECVLFHVARMSRDERSEIWEGERERERENA
jgi:hypothetical protein